MKKPGLFQIVLILLVMAAVIIKTFSTLYIDFLWFKDLGYSQLFTIPIITKLQIGVVSFLIYLVLIFAMGLIAFRVFVNAAAQGERAKNKLRLYVIDNLRPPKEEDVTPIANKKAVLIIFVISFIVSFLISLGVTKSGWMTLLEYRHASSFGVKELVFNKDVSFYIFKMPLYLWVLNSLSFSITTAFLTSLLSYPLMGLIKLKGSIFKKRSVHIPRPLRRFWATLTGLLFILIGIKKYLSIYAIMYSQTGYVYGAGYTDIHVTVPLAKIMTVLAFLCAAICYLYIFLDDHRLILGAFSVYLAAAGIGLAAFGLIQYNVSNNEFVKEKPYIEQEIRFTRMAYNLDKIKVKDYPGTAAITPKNISNNKSTMENIRLNDPKPLKTVLSQNQGLRYYYRFNDIDIDRYNLDGNYRQVLLTARELSKEALTDDKAATFVNLTMRYTHGYGVSATLANEIDESGYAKLIIKDIPPKSQVKGIQIKEPRIYFGELTNDTQYGYVIGNTAAKEFDYPQGDNNVENTYKGKTGLYLTGLNKLFLSAYFDTFRFFMASEINDKSKLLMRRNIKDRVRTLMPYLKYDSDPYIVVADNGKLHWIIDAYTYSDKFPYSTPVGGLNYIRNSVKVVVDPYDGTVDFYSLDNTDPVLKTISSIFPGVFKDPADMPSNLKEHIRYAEDYFNIQAKVLLNFHVNNPSVFYNKEDTWDVAKKIEEGSTVNIEPYYSVMKLPGEKESEFTLMLPFTPASRQEQHRNNLVSWLAARNDGKHYGELILYKVPKNVEVQGPLMIESLIDQDTTISTKMTLWGQGGSEVIRGNLLAVPVDGGFIYVEPIYIRAQQQGASIPQMQAIVFAIDKKIIMVETKSLDKTIAAFFALEGAPPTPGADIAGKNNTGEPRVINPKDSILKKIQLLKQQLQDLENQVKSL